ncbi:hypothetical protein ABPG77_000661 [Micractinium sp. CCAP 211/92]
MRPAVLPCDACAPSCSGRGSATVGFERGLAWPRRTPRRVLASMYGDQQPAQQQRAAPATPLAGQAAAAAGRGGAGPTRTGALSGAMSYSGSTEAPEAPPAKQPRSLLTAAEGQAARDSDGLVQQRQRPLKINLDLALYRARQKRIIANSSRHQHDRSRMMREVEDSLRRCMEVFPEDGRPYVSLGKLLVQQRRYNEALALYEEGCTATGGTNAHIWAAWAYLAAKLNNVGLARRLYDAAIVANPQHAAAWHGWGLLEKEQGNYLRARDLWVKGIQALRRSPNAYLYQSLAVLAAEMDCVEEARKWFKEGTRTIMGRASHALWQAWALMEQKQGDRTLVRPLFRRGLEASPRSRYTHLAWALWEKEEGNLEEARRLFKQGAELNPRDAAILQAWALLEEEQGCIDEARRLLRWGSKVDPSHLYIWQAWGCMEYRQGKYDTARELFQQGIWAAPPREKSVSLVFQAWAMLERDAGNHSLARELFKCAVKADPKSEPSWLVWAQMEEDLGFYQRALELRSYSMQERVEVVKPANFSTSVAAAGGSAGLLAPIFTQIASWFQRYEAESGKDEPELPEMLTLLDEVEGSSGSNGSSGSSKAEGSAPEAARELQPAAARSAR